MEPRDPAAHSFFVNREGRGEMIKAPIHLQDLRRRIYVKVKAELGLINLGEKCAGARSAGNLHAACEVAGVGNGTYGLPRQPSTLPLGLRI